MFFSIGSCRFARRAVATLHFLAALYAAPTFAQAPAELVKDLGPPLNVRAESMRDSIAFGSAILFGEGATVGGRPDQGELWKTDGTDAGTVLIKDINPTGASVPHNFQRVGDTVYFVADDGVHNHEIWRTDGTKAGTSLFTDFYPGTVSSQPHIKAMPEGHLLFAADDATGRKLYRTDGTVGDIVTLTPPSVTDVRISPEPCFLNITCLGASGDRYFFTAFEGAEEQPWVTDGTPAGTYKLADVTPPGGVLSNIRFSGAGDGTGYFVLTVRNPGQVTSVWKTDGTPSGTSQVVDFGFVPGTGIDNRWIVANSDGTANFASITTDGNTARIWRTDGTATPVPVAEYSAPGGGADIIRFRAAVNGLFYYRAVNGSFLYRSNGTASGTFPIPISGGPIEPIFTVLNGTTVAVGDEFYITDGTVEGTQALTTGDEGGKHIRRLAVADDYLVTGELTRFDLTPSLTLIQPVGDAIGGPPLPVDYEVFLQRMPDDTVALDTSLLYVSENNDLWRTDGTDAATVPLSPMATLSPFANPTFPCLDRLGTLGVFYGPGNNLWSTDGTLSGTSLIKDIRPDDDVSAVRSCVTDVAGAGYFWGDDGTNFSLWRTDATEGGTQIVRSTHPSGAAGLQAFPDNIVAAGSTAFMNLADGVWTSDGTEPSTLQLTTETAAYLNIFDSDRVRGAALGDDFYWYAHDEFDRCWLWKSDGTPAGTAQFVATDLIDCRYFALARGAGQLFFTNFNGSTNLFELWTTDGTTATAIASFSAIYVLDQSFPFLMIGGDSGVYFVLSDDSTGHELWSSDGTTAGTHIVRDLILGPTSSSPMPLFTRNGLLFFSAEDGIHGRELWRTDGTDAGTWLVSNAYPGIADSNPNSVGALGSTVFFSAPDAGYRSQQLWKVDNLVTCGDGMIDSGEDCDDANGDNSDACTLACHANVCGDGMLRIGVENCDDGNTANGDCCSSTCAFEGAGSACADDGDPCSGDTCDGSGSCEHVIANGAGVVCRPADGPCDLPESCDGINPACPRDVFDQTGSICEPANGGCPDVRCTGTSAECPATYDILPCPAPTTTTTSATTSTTTTTTTLPPLQCPPTPQAGCLTAGAASLQVTDNGDDAKDKLQWKWKKGAAVVAADLGHPRTSASYGLCIYDSTGGVPSHVATVTVPAGFQWSTRPKGDFDYKDNAGSAHGVQKLQLRIGIAGKSSAQLRAKGVNIPMPAPANGTEFFDQDPRVTVQLRNNETSTCWTSEFTSAMRNTSTQYKAKF